MTDPAHALQAIYRWRLSYFAQRAMAVIEPSTKLVMNWHHDAIAYQLERCLRGELKRLLINQPPKTLKTHLVSVAYVAWLLLHDPSLRIGIISYDEELASTQLRKIRQIMKSGWYRGLAAGTCIRKGKDTETLIETTAGGEVRAVSVQGGVTGHGFDYIIIDDPQKASLAHSDVERRKLEELYASAIANRWRNPAQGLLILVMQRLHVDDFTIFLRRACPSAVHLSIPAVADRDYEFEIRDNVVRDFQEGELLEPERLSEAVLAEMRSLQGEVHYHAQYLQAPMATAGRVLDQAWFRRFDEPRKHDYRVISIDPAFTENGGDFSAAIVVNLVMDDLEIVHAERVQFEYPRLVRWIEKLDKAWAPDLLLIETIGSGQGLPAYLAERRIEYIGKIGGHSESKLQRMELVSPRVEAGRVWLPTTADWIRPFLADVGMFPYGANDDWSDALSQLLRYQDRVRLLAAHHRRRRFPPPPPDPRPGMPRGIHYRRWELTW